MIENDDRSENLYEDSFGKIGTLPDGRIIVARKRSTVGVPILEIHDPISGDKVKIRYYDEDKK